MIPLTPGYLIAAASSLIGVAEQGGDNHGPMVERFLGEVKLGAGQPWCAAFVYHVGKWAHYDHERNETSWPLPDTGSCYMLGDFARRRGVLCEVPQDGDIFLV